MQFLFKNGNGFCFGFYCYCLRSFVCLILCIYDKDFFFKLYFDIQQLERFCTLLHVLNCLVTEDSKNFH